MRARLALPLAFLFVTLAASGPARAQTGVDQVAQSLFDEGQALMGQKRYAEACEKFAQSDRVQPSGSAVANLAECLERQGRLASAWRRFKEAEERASVANKADVVKFLREREARLEAQLARVIIATSTADETAVTVKIDGHEIARAEWNGSPVDVGPHKLEATAPGRTGFQRAIDVSKDGERVYVDVPRLAVDESAQPAPTAAPQAPLPAPAPAPGQPEGAGSSWQRPAAIVAGGAGLVVIGVGAYFAVHARSTQDTANGLGCSGSTCPTQAGVDDNASARSSGDMATILLATGGVAVAAGAVLWLTAPSSPRSSAVALRVAPLLGPSTAGGSVVGSWQ
jgi:hypothetical protein